MKGRLSLVSFMAVLFSFSIILGGCGSKAESNASDNNKKDDEKTISIGYQKGNTLNILKESGILEEKLEGKGYNVEWREFVQGGKVLEALYTGNIDFGHAADGPGIFAQAGNKPLVYVGADLPNPEGVGVLVHKDSGFQSVEDLKGKKIGALKGGNHHYLAILAVKDAGLSIDDVEWVFLEDAAQLRSAFETKKIDALATYDPFFASAEIDLDTINLTEGKDYGYPNRTFYYANVDFNKEHPELVDLVLNAIDESDQWANKNKPEVVKLISKALGIDAKVIERATDRRQYAVERVNQDMIDAQQKQADVYYEIGLIPEKVDVSKDMPINE
ncbi:sulfonate ABC transporter substrate-binding protein [Pueribacillus theae]|uniref:Sulfonate ABC transporter substrate-binding protein n=1 Tax=Pueribacillus theae TaxID=2171751 RepID=A0A2U1K0H0_9BACI|nr:aliphatic sulfonate ABC transporter substrate-binding protein [Pueribacillus theae]PWA10669.1 sulfonate ABC transporter substrate-binding protein [Pueribacillus theae]